VERSEVIRGYEHDDSQYVVIEDEELKKITALRAHYRNCGLREGRANRSNLFRLFLFCVARKDSEKAYALLLKALVDKNRVAIATMTMHQREYTVFIRPRERGLTVHTMFFENEIQDVEGYGKTPQEVKLAEQLVETLSEDFEPSKYHDTFQENLTSLIESKQKGRTFVEEPKPARAPVIGMMEALKRSVRRSEASNKANPSRARREHLRTPALGELGWTG
jgi:DNA end-binding protein Ku